MNRFVLGATVIALAAVGANCAGPGSSTSLTAPSTLVASETAGAASLQTQARTGGGGGKKGGGGSTTSGGGSLTLVMVNDANGDALPNWGDTVTFTVSAPNVAEPTVELLCSQGGTSVYGASAGFYASYPWPWAVNMMLSSGAWSSGSADCTATLYPLGSRGTVLATLRFTAGA